VSELDGEYYQIIIYPLHGMSRQKIRALLDDIARHADKADDYEIIIKSRCKGRKTVAIGRMYKMSEEILEFIRENMLSNLTVTIMRLEYV